MAKDLLVNGEMLLYGDVGDPFGFGDGFKPSDVADALAHIGLGDVTARVNSPGGIAYDGMAIYSLFKSHPGKVTMKVDGVSASAASLFTMAGDVIDMRDGAMMMIHDPASITIGPAKTHEDAAARLHKLADNYATVYATRSGNDAKAVRDMMVATTWFTADEAIAKGFATSKGADTAVAMAKFEYDIYPNAPSFLPRRSRAAKQDEPELVGEAAAARMRMRMRHVTP